MLHVVATRVGIGVYDTNWFEYRLSLFETITFPSVVRQTNQDFTWLLVVDQGMPASSMERLKAIVSNHPRVKILEIELKTDFGPAVSAWCKKQKVTDERLMTTRMDDDDAIRLDAFQKLRDMAEAGRRSKNFKYGVLSFSLGARWDPITNRAYRSYHDSLGIGLSFVEPITEARNVYSRPHLDIKALIAPKGAFIDSVGGDEIYWLYTTHAMADTDKGDQKRVTKIREHRHQFEPDLRPFGVSAVAVKRMAEKLGSWNKVEGAFRQTLRGTQLEEQIRELRNQLSTLPATDHEGIIAQITELQKQRIHLGSALTRIED